MKSKAGWETLVGAKAPSSATAPRGANPETALMGAIVQAIEAHGLWVLRIPVQGVMHRQGDKEFRKRSPLAGIPDLLVVGPEGTTAWLEVKTAKGRVSPLQREQLDRLSKLGHVAAVVRSVDEALTVLKENAFIYCPAVDAKVRPLAEVAMHNPEAVEL